MNNNNNIITKEEEKKFKTLKKSLKKIKNKCGKNKDNWEIIEEFILYLKRIEYILWWKQRKNDEKIFNDNF